MSSKAPENSAPSASSGVPAGLSFEGALERLEGIVRKLEAGELSLDDSLAAFEEGVRLSGYCHRRLDEVEKKVQMLLADGSRVPFENAPSGGEGDRGKGE